MGDLEGLTLRERNKARARAEMADAALRLFFDRGIEGVTVDGIVNAAGVSRQHLLPLFRDQGGCPPRRLPRAALQVADPQGTSSSSCELNARLSDALDATEADDAIGAVRAGSHAMADWYIERSDAVLARSKVIRDTSPKMAARNLEFLTQWERDVARAIADQVEADAGDLLPRTAAAMIVGAGRAALTQWVRSSCGEDLHALTDEALDLIEHGLLPVLSRSGSGTRHQARPPRPRNRRPGTAIGRADHLGK
jgi:AcrR family transcriptional regulator